MRLLLRDRHLPWVLLTAVMLLTVAVYAPGLSGSWLFDDYPNIVDNPGVQPDSASLGDLTRAALSSPSSQFKRPLASLTFAFNYLAGGLHPLGWKLLNLLLHLLNGALVFLLMRRLLTLPGWQPARSAASSNALAPHGPLARPDALAALMSGCWMLLPINLTGVLYVVQRMESLSNLFVLAGLLGYMVARSRMMREPAWRWRGLVCCAISLVAGTLLGLTAKETAVMLPLYALLVEWLMFGFHNPHDSKRQDRGLWCLFAALLFLPLLLGLAWVVPAALDASTWSTRDFTLQTRLLSEARIVVGYMAWTLFPLPHWLSFYHDGFVASRGLLQPWTTMASMLVIAALLATIWWQRRRRPLLSLGLALYFGCHLLTATILPLELVYEHRNYFASMGLLLAVVPLLGSATPPAARWLRQGLLAMLVLWWIGMTACTAWAWGEPLRLAEELASRAPHSPRAQYELGRTLIVRSDYDPTSPFTARVYAPLERAAALPGSSILPEQALIFFNARMQRPIEPAWWDSLIDKLGADKPGVQDVSSLAAMTHCAVTKSCEFAQDRMVAAFQAALAHPRPTARLLSVYSDYSWNVLGNYAQALTLIERAVDTAPAEPAYRITLARMAAVAGKLDMVRAQIHALDKINYGGRLDGRIKELRKLLGTDPP